MILSYYFNHQLLSRTLKYLLLLTFLFSVVESIERLMLLPISLSLVQCLSMWVLSWPLYSCLLLPACFYAAYLATAIGLARSQELVIMQLYVSPWSWRWRVGCLSAFLSVAIFFTVGWIGPMCQHIQKDFATMMLSEIQMPKTFSGQFNKIEVGGRHIVVYKEKQKGKGLFVATRLSDAQGITVLTTQKMHVLTDKGVPTLVFDKGNSYSFTPDDGLKYALSFDESRIPLAIKVGLSAKKYQFMQMATHDLWHDQRVMAQHELAWRIHLSLSVMVLATLAMMLIDYMTCRRASSRVYVVGGCLAIMYYVGLLAVKMSTAAVPVLLMHAYYSLLHAGLCVLTWLLTRLTPLLRLR